MSDSVQPHRWQPTRLPCPWDSPGKTTGVGCHFLLQCMKGKSESEVAQSCPTLRDPMDCSPPGSSVHGIFQARVLEWAAIAFSNIIHYSYILKQFTSFSVLSHILIYQTQLNPNISTYLTFLKPHLLSRFNNYASVCSLSAIKSRFTT